MKKLTLIALFGAVTIIAWCGAATPDVLTQEIKPFDAGKVASQTDQSGLPDGYIAFESTDQWLETIIPSDRTTKEQGNKSNFTAPQVDEEYRANFEINITKAQSDWTLSQYAENSLDLIQILVPNVELISKKDVKINKMDAIQLKYRGTQWLLKLEREQYLLTNNGALYIITNTNTEENFKTYNKQRKIFIDNLQLK